MNGAGTWESGSDDLSGPVQMRRSRAQPSDTDSTDGVKLTDEDWQNRLQSWKDRRKKQSQVFETGGQNDTPLDQIQDPAERVAAFRRASRIKSFKEMVEEQRGLGLVIPIGDEDVGESAKSLRERREAAAKENARSYARGFSVSGPSGSAALALSGPMSLDAESALTATASASANANLPQNYSGSRKMSLPGEVQLDSLRNGLRLLDFEEYHEAGGVRANAEEKKRMPAPSDQQDLSSRPAAANGANGSTSANATRTIALNVTARPKNAPAPVTVAPPNRALYGRSAAASASASASNSSAASTASTTTQSRSPGLTPTGSSTSFGAADSSSKPSSASYSAADVTSIGSESKVRASASAERERSTGRGEPPLNEEHMSKLSRGEAPMMSQLLKEAPLIAKTQTTNNAPPAAQPQPLPQYPMEKEEGIEMPRTRHDLHVISGVPQRKFRDTFVKGESPAPNADQSAAVDASKNGPQVNDARRRNRQVRQSERMFGQPGEVGDDANGGRESSNELSVSTNNLNGQQRSSSNSPSKQSTASLNTSAYSSDASSSSFMTSPAVPAANAQFFTATSTFAGQELKQQPQTAPGAVVVRQRRRDERRERTQQMLALSQASGRVSGAAPSSTLTQPAPPPREPSPQQAARVSSRRMEMDPDDENFVRISPTHKPSPGPAVKANSQADSSESPYANTQIPSSTAPLSTRYSTSAAQPAHQQSQNYLANFYQSVDSSSKLASWAKDPQTPPPQQSALGEQSAEQRLSRTSQNSSLTASGQPSAYSATSGRREPSPAPPAPVSDAAADGTPEVSPSQKCAVCSDPLSCGAAMYIEDLHSFFHLRCFRCVVCDMELLPDGALSTTTVRTRAGRLYCGRCFQETSSAQHSPSPQGIAAKHSTYV